ncbi:unnamed protein product [Rhizophagus irregularis]|uniref:HAT C-terminal dimerisation domain-containing protein n=1 Tax=Rhizophagus irregularis TaxID=588596 RepID=A0A915YRR7_9GLOM|nr:unnamed protein product [Rhizophagus irregularis]
MGYNKEKCKHLCKQLKRYKDKHFPFNIPYDDNYETPDLWWNIIDGYDELKQLALKLFAIMPNSASCERGFSKLGWLSGKYRINLSTQSFESLAKMSSYYLSNLKKELIYYGQNISTEEITEIIHSLDFNEIEEADKDSNFEDSNIINDKSNDNVEVIIEWHPLQLENFIDLNNPIITKDLDIIQDDSDTDLSNEESENSQNTNSNNSDNESESNSESEDYNYNPNEIAKDIYNNDDITDDNYTEEKKLNGPEQKVVKISLPQIDPKVHFDFDSREKEDIYDELRSSLKEQLPEWWSQEKVVCIVHSNEYYPDVGSWQQKPSHKQWRFPFIYNCPPPQIWIEVVYNITNDRERALEKIWSSKCYCCKTKFIIIVLPYGKEPYHQNPSPGSDSEEPHTLDIGHQMRTFDRVSWHDIKMMMIMRILNHALTVEKLYPIPKEW